METFTSLKASLPQLGGSIKVDTYVWNDHLECLVPEIWSFNVFVKEKLWRWVSHRGSDNNDYVAVDKRMALDSITRSQHLPPSFEPKSYRSLDTLSYPTFASTNIM